MQVMNSLASMIAPLALLLPATMADAPVPQQSGSENARHLVSTTHSSAPLAAGSSRNSVWTRFFESHFPGEMRQVRIEQTIVLRISPRPAAQADPRIQADRAAQPSRVEERKIGSCIPAQGIAAVGTGQDDRLILFMRDNRVISAALEKSCNARDFYSGFYLERSGDGRLCVKRDKLHSRAGAKCELRQIRQLVAVRD